VLHAFSWGYKGWGNHTPALVELVDAVETGRGFEPPVFVDVRLRRQVRAVGFRDRAFERLLGPRHRWLPGLGNRAIANRALAMALAEPRAIDDLLEAIVSSAPRRRVIFFCSCASPEARASCHRGLVVRELVAAARRARLALAIEEWPGGAPVIATLDVTRGSLPEVRAPRIALPANVSLAAAGALPHGSIVRSGHGVSALAHPVIRTARGWVLPIHEPSTGGEDRLRRQSLALRRELALERFGARDATPAWRTIALGGIALPAP
jgi:hypothetical protein